MPLLAALAALRDHKKALGPNVRVILVSLRPESAQRLFFDFRSSCPFPLVMPTCLILNFGASGMCAMSPFAPQKSRS